MRTTQLVAIALLVSLVLVACAPAAAPAPLAPAPQAASPAQAPVAAPAGPAQAQWEVTWEKTLAEAKKEGRLMLSTALGAQPRTDLVQGLKKAYGINLETVAARSTETNAKILAERRAGLYLWDVAVGGSTSPYTDLEPGGVIEPMDSYLILPEVTDPAIIKKTWYRGELWWVDSRHLLLAPIMFPHPPLAVNTTMVNPAEFKSYNDFLDPKWKGKLTINDPTQAGTTFQSFIIQVFGADWLRKLVKQEPVIMRDQRLQVDWLAKNKNPIALGVKVEVYTEFKAIGAPIQQVVPAEGTWLSGDSAIAMVFNRPPHPNAAKVFINWMMSKEGVTLLSRAVGGQSAREDVTVDFLTQEQLRQPGVKYWEKERKDVSLRKADDINLCKEIFAPLMK